MGIGSPRESSAGEASTRSDAKSVLDAPGMRERTSERAAKMEPSRLDELMRPCGETSRGGAWPAGPNEPRMARTITVHSTGTSRSSRSRRSSTRAAASATLDGVTGASPAATNCNPPW